MSKDNLVKNLFIALIVVTLFSIGLVIYDTFIKGDYVEVQTAEE